MRDKRLADDEIESTKFVALGRFASEISHHVRNPLAVILGWAEILDARVSGGDALSKTAVRSIIEAALKADGLMRNFSKTVKPFRPRWEEVEVTRLVEEALELVRYRDPLAEVRVTTQFPEKGFSVRVDRDLMRLGLFHILMNAAQAVSGKGGEIRVVVSKGDAPQVAEQTCRISVQDTGDGIPPSTRKDIFELSAAAPSIAPRGVPRQRSRGLSAAAQAPPRKVGWGLPIAKLIVESHSGQIALESIKGQGTTVEVLLPA